MFYENIEPQVYNLLIESVESNLQVEHNLLDVKRKILNVKKVIDNITP